MSSKVSVTPRAFSTKGKAGFLLSSSPPPFPSLLHSPALSPAPRTSPHPGPSSALRGERRARLGAGTAAPQAVGRQQRCQSGAPHFLRNPGILLLSSNPVTQDLFFFFFTFFFLPLNKSPLLRSPLPTLLPQQDFQGGAEPRARSSLPWAPRHRAPPRSSRARTRRRRRRAAAGVPEARRQQRGSSPGRASPASALCRDGRAERGRGAAAGMRAQFRGSFFSFSLPPHPPFFRCPHPPPSPRNIQGSKILGMEKMRRQRRLPDALQESSQLSQPLCKFSPKLSGLCQVKNPPGNRTSEAALARERWKAQRGGGGGRGRRETGPSGRSQPAPSRGAQPGGCAARSARPGAARRLGLRGGGRGGRAWRKRPLPAAPSGGRGRPSSSSSLSCCCRLPPAVRSRTPAVKQSPARPGPSEKEGPGPRGEEKKNSRRAAVNQQGHRL